MVSPVEAWVTRVGFCPPSFVKGRRVTPLERSQGIAARVAAAYGLEVFDLTMRREGKQDVLRVVLDRPGPAATPEDSVSIEDCATVSHELGTILDVEDLL